MTCLKEINARCFFLNNTHLQECNWRDKLALDKEAQKHNEQRRGHMLAESPLWSTTEKAPMEGKWKLPATQQHPMIKFPAPEADVKHQHSF